MCQRIEFAVNKHFDLVCPCHGVSGFRVHIPRSLVSLVEVVTQILAGIDARLYQLGVVLV